MGSVSWHCFHSAHPLGTDSTSTAWSWWSHSKHLLPPHWDQAASSPLPLGTSRAELGSRTRLGASGREESPSHTRDDVDDVVGDAQGLVELLSRGHHLLKQLPGLVVTGGGVDELLDLAGERGPVSVPAAAPLPQERCDGALTFSNWCTRKMPRVSRPWEPTSCRKHVESPAYLSGSSSGRSHSSRCSAAMGCSDVAIRYFSSMELSSALSLPLPITCAGTREAPSPPCAACKIGRAHV